MTEQGTEDEVTSDEAVPWDTQGVKGALVQGRGGSERVNASSEAGEITTYQPGQKRKAF